MKMIGSTELETQDLGHSLQFVRTRTPGWLGIVVEVVAIGGFGLYACWKSSIILILFAAIAMIGVMANFAHGNETLLRVSDKGILARGHLHSWFTTELSLPVEEITAMGWSAGVESDGGVYVSRGYTQTWVLRGATEEQGRTIIAAIQEKFPDFPIADRTAASLLFGDESGVTTLNLTKSESQSTNSEQ